MYVCVYVCLWMGTSDKHVCHFDRVVLEPLLHMKKKKRNDLNSAGLSGFYASEHEAFDHTFHIHSPVFLST